MVRTLTAGRFRLPAGQRGATPRGSFLLALGLGLAVVVAAGGADGRTAGGGLLDLDAWQEQGRRASALAVAWYERTPASDRVTWGGLAASAVFGLGVVLERLARLGRKRVVPSEFAARFLGRLRDGKLDRGKAQDYCELNRSPAARVALAAVRRWGRPVADLERAVLLAHRVEADRLRRNVGTLRRLAALTPLLGLLGSLLAAGRTLAGLQGNAGAGIWGPALASSLAPLTAGIALSIVALVLYDGLAGKVEALAGALERIGAETIDAIAMAMPPEPRPVAHAPTPAPTPPSAARTPHQFRLDYPGASHRRLDRAHPDRDDDFD